MSEWKFKRDTAFRKQFFVPDSFAHPAKMDAQLLIKIVETYTKPGEVILDPMAGMGTTMLACTLGRSVILVELEEKFCKMCRDNWGQVKMRPQLGSAMGECQIIQGDARNLEGLLADKIITSPPYAEQIHPTGETVEKVVATNDPKHLGKYSQALLVDGYSSENPSNIGNLSYGDIDAVITSPPYEGSIVEGNENFEGMRHLGTISKDNISQKRKELRQYQFKGGETSYSQGKANIGNLKSNSYLSAMLQVYAQCYKVLKSGGLMILVTKNFIRNKKIVRLDRDTINLCSIVGFKFRERHYRELPAQSFWRTIYKQKYPDAPEIKYEDVLVFDKE